MIFCYFFGVWGRLFVGAGDSPGWDGYQRCYNQCSNANMTSPFLFSSVGWQPSVPCTARYSIPVSVLVPVCRIFCGLGKPAFHARPGVPVAQCWRRSCPMPIHDVNSCVFILRRCRVRASDANSHSNFVDYSR